MCTAALCQRDRVGDISILPTLMRRVWLGKRFALSGSLNAQQTTFTRLHSARDNIMQASNGVSELITEKLINLTSATKVVFICLFVSLYVCKQDYTETT